MRPEPLPLEQEFNSYSDEMDEERIKQISEQALKDVDWVLDKVSIIVHIEEMGTPLCYPFVLSLQYTKPTR